MKKTRFFTIFVLLMLVIWFYRTRKFNTKVDNTEVSLSTRIPSLIFLKIIQNDAYKVQTGRTLLVTKFVKFHNLM
jgi:hypothetical protein